MKEISLANSDLKAVVSDADFLKVSQFKWSLITPRPSTHYAEARICGRSVRMHNLIKSGLVDHHDCDGLNNTRRNLRPCTVSQNGGNRRKLAHRTSHFKGVHLFKTTGKWRASIWCRRKYEYLGYFSSEIDAARAYNKAARRLFGRFARLNTI